MKERQKKKKKIETDSRKIGRNLFIYFFFSGLESEFDKRNNVVGD